MEQQMGVAIAVFLVSVIWLAAELLGFFSECINRWLYQRARRRFYAEIKAGKQPAEVPYLITSDGGIHREAEDITHSESYKRFGGFREKNGH